MHNRFALIGCFQPARAVCVHSMEEICQRGRGRVECSGKNKIISRGCGQIIFEPVHIFYLSPNQWSRHFNAFTTKKVFVTRSPTDWTKFTTQQMKKKIIFFRIVTSRTPRSENKNEQGTTKKRILYCSHKKLLMELCLLYISRSLMSLYISPSRWSSLSCTSPVFP